MGDETSSPTCTTAERPRWLGTITLAEGVRAQDQMAAIMLAAQSERCGRNSPARVFGGNVARQLWDSCVVSCTRWVISDSLVANKGGGPWARCITRFGVSPLLMGIATAVFVAPQEALFAEAYGATRWIDKDRVCVNAMGNRYLRDTTTGEDRVLSRGNEPNFCVNEKWYLQATSEDHGVSLVIASLKREEEPPVCFLDGTFDVEIKSMNFSSTVPSEAVIMVKSKEDPTRGQFVVVDVAQMYLTKKLEVLHTTSFASPPPVHNEKVDSFLVMENKAGESIFIVESCNYAQTRVFSVQPNQEAKKLYRCTYSGSVLFQVSASLYSINCRERASLEIWDYFDTLREKPTPRILQNAAGYNYLTGCGFILLVMSEGKGLKLMEAS
ncbi:hypothetical protein Pelo_12708 [Pelomyxa schiedti]|nr:hypothetical protein Pelo_12708 [Pelomyxa schiedti]